MPNDCNIADVLFISQIYNVKPELKYNKEQMLRLYSSSPNNAKPYGVPCQGTVTMRVGLSLPLTDNGSKPLKAAGLVTNWW
jgi:hypothetical protein